VKTGVLQSNLRIGSGVPEYPPHLLNWRNARETSGKCAGMDSSGIFPFAYFGEMGFKARFFGINLVIVRKPCL